MSQPYESGLVSSAFKEVAQETTAALLASAAFTGATIDLGVGGGKVSATARSDQSGTLTLQESPDATTWTTVASAATGVIGSNSIATASVITDKRYARVVYTNGSTNQTRLQVDRLAVA